MAGNQRFIIGALAGWLIALSGIVGIAYWFHTHPQVLVTVDNRQPSHALGSADKALAEGDYDKVLELAPIAFDFNQKLFKRLQQDQHRSVMARALALSAMAYMQRGHTGDREKALQKFKEFYELEPGVYAGKALYFYGRLLLETGNADQAEKILVEALQRGNGGWVGEVQSLRYRLAQDSGDAAKMLACLYDLIRYCDPYAVAGYFGVKEDANSWSGPAVPESGSTGNKYQLAYLKAVPWQLVAGDMASPGLELQDLGKRYLELMPGDLATKMFLKNNGISISPQTELETSKLPIDIPLHFNYKPPDTPESARTQFPLPGGTIFDIVVAEEMPPVQLAVEISVVNMPPNDISLYVLYDDVITEHLSLQHAVSTVYTVPYPVKPGRHRVSFRFEGETFNLEEKPLVRLHHVTLINAAAGNDGGGL